MFWDFSSGWIGSEAEFVEGSETVDNEVQEDDDDEEKGNGDNRGESVENLWDNDGCSMSVETSLVSLSVSFSYKKYTLENPSEKKSKKPLFPTNSWLSGLYVFPVRFQLNRNHGMNPDGHCRCDHQWILPPRTSGFHFPMNVFPTTKEEGLHRNT